MPYFTKEYEQEVPMTEYNEKNNGFKIRLEDISTVEKKVFVEISKEHVDKQFESAYAEFKKHAHLKGFRKGHIPKNLIRDQYKKPIPWPPSGLRAPGVCGSGGI